MRAALLDAFDAARDAGDNGSMAEAALELSRALRFGPTAGQVPVLLHEAYVAADEPATRCRLAAALARAWVYGSDARRARALSPRGRTPAARTRRPAPPPPAPPP